MRTVFVPGGHIVVFAKGQNVVGPSPMKKERLEASTARKWMGLVEWAAMMVNGVGEVVLSAGSEFKIEGPGEREERALVGGAREA